jgi:hypothetical protein
MILMAAIALLVVPFAFCGEAVATTAAAQATTDWVLALLKGGALGVSATLIGWLKNAEVEKFDWRGMALKVPVGFVVGVIAAYQNVPFDSALAYATGIGLITVLDQVVKLIVRRMLSALGWDVLGMPDV